MKELKMPKFMTIREVAKMGVLPEHKLRMMGKAGELPCIYSGKRCLINVDMLIEQLNHLGE